MIKTKRFLSIFLLLSFTLLSVRQAGFCQTELGEITLTASSKQSLNVSDRASVFLPSKLVIGEGGTFVVKGTPGAKVSLAVSNSNRGANPLMGHKLRLGETETTIEAVISPTGAVEINYPVPDDQALISKIKFFEVAIWTKDDFSDLTIARTISPAGKETLNNGIVITTPPEKNSRPTFSPLIPGVGQDMVRALEKVKEAKEGKINPDLIDDGEAPAYLDSSEKRDLMLQNMGDQ